MHNYDKIHHTISDCGWYRLYVVIRPIAVMYFRHDGCSFIIISVDGVSKDVNLQEIKTIPILLNYFNWNF